MWAGVWSWLSGIMYWLLGHYKSQPVAKPATEAASSAPVEKVEEVCETIEESDLWKAVQQRNRE